ncbi:MAG: nucleoside deaminase [Bdellovibrionota bacterium]
MTEKLKALKIKLEAFKQKPSITKKQGAIVSAIEEAIEAGFAGNYSVGTVLVDSKFNVVSRGRNTVFKPKFRSEAHAEMNAISSFEVSDSKDQKDRLTLISTLEPCLMCTARILLSGISRILFLQRDGTAGVCDKLHLFPSNYQELSKRVSFTEIKDEPALNALAKDLYEIGEAIWSKEYGL